MAVRLAEGEVLEPPNTWPKGVLDWCSKYGHLGARRCSAHLKQPLERPKYTVLSGHVHAHVHVFIWSHYLRVGLRLCAFDLRNAQFSTVLGLLRPEIPVEKG